MAKYIARSNIRGWPASKDGKVERDIKAGTVIDADPENETHAQYIRPGVLEPVVLEVAQSAPAAAAAPAADAGGEKKEPTK